MDDIKNVHIKNPGQRLKPPEPHPFIYQTALKPFKTINEKPPIRTKESGLARIMAIDTIIGGILKKYGRLH